MPSSQEAVGEQARTKTPDCGLRLDSTIRMSSSPTEETGVSRTLRIGGPCE